MCFLVFFTNQTYQMSHTYLVGLACQTFRLFRQKLGPEDQSDLGGDFAGRRMTRYHLIRNQMPSVHTFDIQGRLWLHAILNWFFQWHVLYYH
jgi:hypothetical protein